ncbi:hypothetical protein RUM44_013235 [Polyplax serrata]|uniref:Protein GUCD1 n=1 Tax=Polyplax serrata TaxID=468196 RepID=A0ABR1BDL0_POLSC
MYDLDIDSEGGEEYEIKLVHCKQKNTWDCGLSCIMMVLSEKEREFFINNFDEICKAEGFGKSTWTIDLCYLMKRFSIEFIFYTTVVGIDPGHKSQFFYAKILPQDRERVIQKFRDAKKSGIDVREKSVRTRELIRHIKYCGPVILLVNAGYLTCDHCKKNNFTTKLIHCFPQSTNYHGHYIVLCGYSLKNKQLYYRNPAYSNRLCAVKFSALNKARFSYGTDEDCIFIFQ